MRLLTRSDFDGLACAALLKEAGIIDSWKFAHPKDLQDGLVPVDENDCLANVPYVKGCGLWFDHHSSEQERMNFDFEFKGERTAFILIPPLTVPCSSGCGHTWGNDSRQNLCRH